MKLLFRCRSLPLPLTLLPLRPAALPCRSIRDEDAVRRAISRSNVVINMVRAAARLLCCLPLFLLMFMQVHGIAVFMRCLQRPA